MVDERGLSLASDALLAECDFSTVRVSGPGGQHRNRRDTGVRLRHRPTGVTAEAAERRSQRQNRAVALRRLRRRIALTVRKPVALVSYQLPPELAAILPGASQRIGPTNERFWAGVACLLDLFVAAGCSVAETAALLGLSTGALSRLFLSDAPLLAAVNGLRERHGFLPLRA